MTTRRGRDGSRAAEASSLDDFGIVVDDEKARYRSYVTASSKLNPKERAAWWRDIFRRDPEMLEYYRGGSGR